MHQHDEAPRPQGDAREGEVSLGDQAQLERVDLDLEIFQVELFDLEIQLHCELAEVTFEAGLQASRLRSLAEQLESIRELQRWARTERGATARLAF